MSQNKYTPSWSVLQYGGASSHGQNSHHSSRSSSTQPLSALYEEPPRSIQSVHPSASYSNYSPQTTNQHSYPPISPTIPMNFETHPSSHVPLRPQSTMPHPAYPQYIARPHSSLHTTPYLLSPRWPSNSLYPVPERSKTVAPSNRAPSPPIGYTASQHIENRSSFDPPLSPARPFACDLCSLSFNRQHDLKRHRETHTGDKPFLCNGGCGKTFTRKDALKRHQLVKSCGNIDE